MFKTVKEMKGDSLRQGQKIIFKKGRFEREPCRHSRNDRSSHGYEKVNGWLNNRMNIAAEKLSDSEDGTGETVQSTTLRDKEMKI